MDLLIHSSMTAPLNSLPLSIALLKSVYSLNKSQNQDVTYSLFGHPLLSNQRASLYNTASDVLPLRALIQTILEKWHFSWKIQVYSPSFSARKSIKSSTILSPGPKDRISFTPGFPICCAFSRHVLQRLTIHSQSCRVIP
jgi:hypothetical protein